MAAPESFRAPEKRIESILQRHVVTMADVWPLRALRCTLIECELPSSACQGVAGRVGVHSPGASRCLRVQAAAGDPWTARRASRVAELVMLGTMAETL
jgi:hypothetical protein